MTHSKSHPSAAHTVVLPTVMRAQGTFTVAFDSQPPYDTSDGITLAKSTVKKQFSGDLQASSTVEMTSARTAVKGSAVYVAIERVHGTLAGRSGSFVLAHMGTMNRGASELILRVVPDSGTGELHGLSGTMTIDIAAGVHSYGFDYSLSASPDRTQS